MKFNTKVYTVANIQTKHWGCNATIYQTTTYAQTSPGHPMGNMNTVELQTHTNSFRKCIGEYREWRKRTGLFIWVSGNRLFDAG
jgi:hypothetical protein